LNRFEEELSEKDGVGGGVAWMGDDDRHVRLQGVSGWWVTLSSC
jgi:hypothetical protein